MDDNNAYVLVKFLCLTETKMKNAYGKCVQDATENEIIECQEAVNKEVMA